MPTLRFQGHTLTCPQGANLRQTLLNAGLSPHNGNARWFNCKGMGTCGTCALKITQGTASPPTRRERWRLDFPPHTPDAGLRLACQCRVLEDLDLEKYSGFWGQHAPLPQPNGSSDGDAPS